MPSAPKGVSQSVRAPGQPGAQSEARLKQLQQTTARAIMRPLASDQRMQRTWWDGRSSKRAAAEFIKPNDRLSSYERLEIYNRQYWFRLLDCLYDDYPGLRAILGEGKFYKLRVAYLSRYPSVSFTLRNLGSRLERFLLEEPQWTGPHRAMCLDMARFEWAQVVAFDGEERPVVTADDLLGKNPAHLKLAIQPYISLLELRYPLDDFVLALKKGDAALRSEASNAVGSSNKHRRGRGPALPKPRQVFLAVHRFENDLYYKRLSPAQFRLLSALQEGNTLARACEQVSAEDESSAAQIGTWFKTWMELGWFCQARLQRSRRRYSGK